MRNLAACVLMLSLAVPCAREADAASAPVTVSPGHATRIYQVDSRCPTFLWGAAADAEAFELVVYRLAPEGRGEETRPMLRQTVAGSARGWTPALARCLETGARYAWAVRALGAAETSQWSTPALFEVPGPTAVGLSEALAVVRGYLVLDAKAASGGSGASEAVDPPDTPRPAGVGSPGPRGQAATVLSVDQGVAAASFSGDGSALTNLTPANLASAVPIAKGGSGATTAPGALASLGAAAATALTSHALTGTAHHAAPTSLPPSGAAGGDLAGSYPNPTVSDSLARDGELTAAVDLHTADASAHHTARRPLYYLATGGHNGASALSACAVGFHFASIYEILDPSNLRYDTARGATTADSGSGPPQVAQGWIRTGDIAANQNDVGFANCSNASDEPWASSLGSHYGTYVWFEDPLAVDWNAAASKISPWSAGTAPCSITFGVWCVED